MRRFGRALSTLLFAGTLSPTAAPTLAAQHAPPPSWRGRFGGAFAAQWRQVKDADAMLHLVLAEISTGTEGLAGKNRQPGRHGGAVKIYPACSAIKQHVRHRYTECRMKPVRRAGDFAMVRGPSCGCTESHRVLAEAVRPARILHGTVLLR